MEEKRLSGVLLHITSLPSPFGIGDLGPWAYRFADFLATTGQTYWQMLPVNPTSPFSGNSPYSSVSAFAANPLLVSPEVLAEWGLLSGEEIADPPSFPRDRCDYDGAIGYKRGLLFRAWERFRETAFRRGDFEDFCRDEGWWLDDYALFAAVKERQGGRAWGDWPKDLRDRSEAALDGARVSLAPIVEREKFFQFLFFSQWRDLHTYCNERGIRLIGDIPIYASYDSADVWAHPETFNLDANRRPLTVGGVPPDYFSSTGQLWGNPTYHWEALERTGFQWWMDRFALNLSLFDVVRIDHFRGFVGFWEVPAREKTAMNGRWAEAPAEAFFTRLLGTFPPEALIAEDLGIITPDVVEVMTRFRLRGMRILQFGFQEENPGHAYLPHNYVPLSVAYTGTHDNNTARGWFEGEAGLEERRRFFRYAGREVPPEGAAQELMRLVMMSPAGTAIFPMQDILGLGAEARMNRPSVAGGNWAWRLLPEALNDGVSSMLGDMTWVYGRQRRP